MCLPAVHFSHDTYLTRDFTKTVNLKEQKILDLINECRYKALVILEASVKLREDSENYSSDEEKRAAIRQIDKLNQTAVDLNLKADYLIFKLLITPESENAGF